MQERLQDVPTAIHHSANSFISNYSSGPTRGEDPAIPPSGSESDLEQGENGLDSQDIHSPDMFEEDQHYSKHTPPRGFIAHDIVALGYLRHQISKRHLQVVLW